MRACRSWLSIALTTSLLAASFGASVPNAFAQPAGEAADTEPADAAPEKPADDTEKSKADKLFEDGRSLMAEGKYDLACTKFDQSHKLRPGIGVLFNLAECNEKRNRLGTAYNQYLEVAERTKAALQTDREKIARDRIAKLEKQIMRLRVIVPSLSKVKAVLVDGKPLDPKDFGQAMVVDPGEHVITAKTANDAGEPFEETVELDEPGEVVTVTIPVGAGPKMKPRYGMIIGGGITAGIGVILLGGTVAVATGGDGFQDAGLAVGLGVLSVVHMAVGFPIFGVGFKKRPAYDAGLPVRNASLPVVDVGLPLPLLGGIPEFEVGPTSANLTVRF